VKVVLLQTHTRILYEALERKILQHFEQVLVHKNPVFKEDDDANTYRQPISKQLSETTSNSSIDEVHLTLSKPIIRPWEEIRNNKHITNIRYEKEVTFHNPDYTKEIQFQIA
jgi:hypothetical protein